MSRYVEMAHRVADVLPARLIETVAKAVAQRPFGNARPYNDRGRRLDNINAAIERHERDLTTARSPTVDGAISQGRILQLTRRLHQARSEFQDLTRSFVAIPGQPR